MKIQRALIIPDTHVPYHDKKAFSLMLRAVKTEHPDLAEIVLLGDFGEFASVGSHPKDPQMDRSFQREVKAVRDELDRLDKLFPKANKVYIEGNHCDRLTRYLRDVAPELDGLVEAKELLLKGRKKWTWVDYGPGQQYSVLGSKLLARHEPTGGGEHCAAGTVKSCGASVIFGHVHRIQEFQTVDIEGKNHRGITPGWLGDANHPIFNYVKKHHQWALGFSLVTVLPKGLWFNQTIHIINHKLVLNGKVYE